MLLILPLQSSIALMCKMKNEQALYFITKWLQILIITCLTGLVYNWLG